MTQNGLLLTVSFLFSISAQAGVIHGGGGQGVLCSNSDGTRTVRSLDLYEAENIWDYNVPPTTDLVHEMRRVYPHYQIYYQPRNPSRPPTVSDSQINAILKAEFSDQFLAQLKPAPTGSHLNLIDDAGKMVLRLSPNCSYVQVLYYADDDIVTGKVLVDQEYWNLLSPQDQLAFFFHEQIFKYLRAYGETTSERSRKVVGLLFRSAGYPGVVSDAYDETSLTYCSAGTAHSEASFFVVPRLGTGPHGEPRRYARLLFTSLGDFPLLVTTSYDSIWNFDRWVNGEPFDTSGQIDWTRSLLGSVRVNVGFTDNQCIQKGIPCVPKISLMDSTGTWIDEGVLSCRKWR